MQGVFQMQGAVEMQTVLEMRGDNPSDLDAREAGPPPIEAGSSNLPSTRSTRWDSQTCLQPINVASSRLHETALSRNAELPHVAAWSRREEQVAEECDLRERQGERRGRDAQNPYQNVGR
jgi:hypothetical protein